MHCHSCLLVTKAACWPTTRHSHPVITPCLRGRKGRKEGRKDNTPTRNKSPLKIADPFQGERDLDTHRAAHEKHRATMPAPHPGLFP